MDRGDGITEPSTSPWATPIDLPKKNERKNIINYANKNSHTQKGITVGL